MGFFPPSEIEKDKESISEHPPPPPYHDDPPSYSHPLCQSSSQIPHQEKEKRKEDKKSNANESLPFLHHFVTPTDTIQGLAIRYNTTVSGVVYQFLRFY